MESWRVDIAEQAAGLGGERWEGSAEVDIKAVVRRKSVMVFLIVDVDDLQWVWSSLWPFKGIVVDR